jgi:polar amino acid transport system substrate-binding protein
MISLILYRTQRKIRYITFLLFILCPSAYLAACEKTLRWDDDPPYSMQSDAGEVIGISVDFSRAVIARLGCKTKLRKLPWARALKELENGRLDILPDAFRRPERESYAFFSGTVVPPSRNILFIYSGLKEKFSATNLIDLKSTSFRLGAQIGVIYGQSYEDLMNSREFAQRTVKVSKRSNLWMMLGKNRIDGVIANELTGMYEINQLGLADNIEATQVVASGDQAEFAFSKVSTSGSFTLAFTSIARELVLDGTYKRIKEHYVRF